MSSIKDAKKNIREKMLSLRNMLTQKDIKDMNEGIRNSFNSLEFGYCPDNYMSYVSIGNEVNTVEIIRQLLLDGKKISVPVCIPETTKLLASQIFDLDELTPSNFGLLEPKKEFIRPVEPEEIEIVLVPGLAFDRNGNRLGYGKGYYDRFLTGLSTKALKVGLAYSFQIIDQVPIDDFDVPLDIIITEKGIISF